jgi:hypothetical protein
MNDAELKPLEPEDGCRVVEWCSLVVVTSGAERPVQLIGDALERRRR